MLITVDRLNTARKLPLQNNFLNGSYFKKKLSALVSFPDFSLIILVVINTHFICSVSTCNSQMYDLVMALSGKLKSFLSEIFLVRQVLINHNRINWFLVSEEMKLSNPCTPWFATSPWNLHFSCRLTLLCLKGGVNKGIFFLLCSDAGDRSRNHCPAALPAAPDARCGGQVLHGKCVGKHIFPVRFEGVCSNWHQAVVMQL